MKEDKYKGYKIIKLESEKVNVKNEWDTIGIKGDRSCPECFYLGRICDRCKGEN